MIGSPPTYPAFAGGSYVRNIMDNECAYGFECCRWGLGGYLREITAGLMRDAWLRLLVGMSREPTNRPYLDKRKLDVLRLIHSHEFAYGVVWLGACQGHYCR